MKKHLIIDGQILQTDAWHRGMGKYTLQVIHELSEASNDDLQISLIFNSTLDCDPERFAVMKYLCPKAEQYHVKLPLSKEQEATPKTYVRRLTDYIDEQFSGLDNYYMITSLFTFAFYAEFPTNCHKALLFYDLNPLLFWQDLGGYFLPHLYMKRFKTIYEADLIFSISDTTKNDLVRTFGIDADTITNINGGFTKLAAHSTSKEFKLPEKFILFPTADLPHKNNELAIEGFSLFNKSAKSTYKLLITSTFHEAHKQKLLDMNPNVIFTGNVSDEQLVFLYEKSDAVLFASKCEGLGIPMLDGVANNKPIVASRIPVLEEMATNAFYFFDPYNAKELADRLKQAVSKQGFDEKRRSYPAIMKKYTWAATGAALLKGLEKYASRQAREDRSESPPSKRIAMVCLNPGIANQIGRLAEPLYLKLSQKYKLDFYFDSTGLSTPEMERPTFLDYVDATVADIHNLSFTAYRKYDTVIYLMDDLSLSSVIVRHAAVLPGVLLHNFTTKSSKVLKDAIISNQSLARKLPATLTSDYDGLVGVITDLIENRSITKEESIIKNNWMKRSIMKKLMAGIKND
jgi:glycosyltransferase involved in cell wall biosynthesis